MGVEESNLDLGSVREWAGSGAMLLTGPADGAPLGPPERMVPRLRWLSGILGLHAERQGMELAVDTLQLLVDRASLSGLSRQGEVSCGGSTRLIRVRDGWIAVALTRPSDVDVVPAWLELHARSDDLWTEVTARAGVSPSAEMVDRGRLVGLPVSALGEVSPGPGDHRGIGRAAAPEGARPRRLGARWWSISRPCGPGRCVRTSSRGSGRG